MMRISGKEFSYSFCQRMLLMLAIGRVFLFFFIRQNDGIRRHYLCVLASFCSYLLVLASAYHCESYASG